VTAALLRLNDRTFVSLRRHRNYRLFFSGQVVSVTGTWMQNVASAWLIVQLTHSPLAVGVLALAQFLPFTLFGLFAGTLVDRLDARRLVIGTQVVQMVLAIALAAVALGGIAVPWMVYLIAFGRGSVLVLDAPARQALTYRMVGRSELPNAVALNSSLFNASRVVGPAIGGLVIALFGTGVCFAFNAASFVAVLLGLLLMRESDMLPVEQAETRPTILRGTREGLRYVWRDPRIRAVLVVVLVVSTFGFNFNVLLPVLAASTLHAGPQTFGILSAFFGAGALVGALTAASLARATRKVLLGGTGLFGLFELALAPQHSTVAACAFLFAIGAAFTTWTASSIAGIQLSAPDHLRGRVVGLYYYAFNGTAPAGGLLAGWLCTIGGTELAFGVGGAATVAATGYGLFQIRDRRRRLPVADEVIAEPASDSLAA
jgi:MFS family permease